LNIDRRSFECWIVKRTSRRDFLAGAGAVTGALSLPATPTRARLLSLQSEPESPLDFNSPFALGVASGDPVPDGAVIWTRLVLDPVTGGELPRDPIDVRWEVALDDSFRKIVRQGSERAEVDLAHSIHADPTGLQPRTDYYYRFLAGGAVSPTGRLRTAPEVDATVDRLDFGFASCANWEHGFFAAYRDLAAQDLDVVLFLGDYIYEYAPDRDYQSGNEHSPRSHTGGETMTLEDYRQRHALYKTDPDLQAAHAGASWIVTWDDHEVENNYANDHSPTGLSSEAFLARRAAAYQAFYEHMPLRPESLPVGPDMKVFRYLTYGTLAGFHVLDTRQYRSVQPCGNMVGPRCAAASDPDATLLGDDQEAWLLDGLEHSPCQWNVVAQQVMMSELAIRGIFTEPAYLDDQWDGYPLARNRLLGAVRDAQIQNVVVLTGDAHSAWVNDLKADFSDPASPVVATEFVATSVTSKNPVGPALALTLPGNPHIKFLDLRHGYTLCRVGADRWEAEFRAIDSALDPAASARTIATFVIKNAVAGAVPG
jgi:alkaline phosphatase D